MTWQEFEALARTRMGRELDTEFRAASVPGVPKKFDMVSADSKSIGDAKYLTLVKRSRIPPAKFIETPGMYGYLEEFWPKDAS